MYTDGLQLQCGFQPKQLVRFSTEHAKGVDHEKQGLVRPVEWPGLGAYALPQREQLVLADEKARHRRHHKILR